MSKPRFYADEDAYGAVTSALRRADRSPWAISTSPVVDVNSCAARDGSQDPHYIPPVTGSAGKSSLRYGRIAWCSLGWSHSGGGSPCLVPSACTSSFPRTSSVVAVQQEEGRFAVPLRKTKPLAGQGVWRWMTLLVKAEGKGFEPPTGCPAPDFESQNWLQLPSRYPSVARFSRGFLRGLVHEFTADARFWQQLWQHLLRPPSPRIRTVRCRAACADS